MLLITSAIVKTSRVIQRARLLHTSSVVKMPIQVGEHLPAVEVQEGEPGNKVAMDQLFKGKKGVLFAVPGAFTPGCSKTHLPGFVQQAADLKSKGIQEVACISVNDAFVMAAWGKEHGTDGKVRMLADPTGAFTKVKLSVWYIKVLCNVTVYSSACFSLPLRLLTCYLTVIRLCRYLGTSDPRDTLCWWKMEW
ncbi:peroxiredoxin-5, mitochondrial isoform X1 [Etheostoma spectabile]|uniref:peroxiredoxin-5, mitochondrial isoform X1 n=1 Tax=Etheostoma spectabile TaxID=54343 RepID=UPI0013AEA56F|nr:peroxiredoxin-5, mitochondrial isoform X1 [Etheostoma spectabile]